MILCCDVFVLHHDCCCSTVAVHSVKTSQAGAAAQIVMLSWVHMCTDCKWVGLVACMDSRG